MVFVDRAACTDGTVTVVLPLRTERLLLRMLGPGDLGAFVAYRNDPDIARHQEWPVPYPFETATALVAEQSTHTGPTEDEWVQLAIEHKGDVAGDLAVHLDRHGAIATLGYTLAPAYHGRGFAREAVGAIVDALAERGVHRFVASISPEHFASMRVVESVGFTFEALSRRSALVRGAWTDDVTYALLAEDRLAWRRRPRHRPEQVRLVEITADDAADWGRLAVHHSQARLVSPVFGSFRDALFPEVVDGAPLVPWLRGIVADGERAGFMMVAEANEHHPEPYLWRLLVDRWHQGRGIGERAVGLLLERLRREGCRSVTVSFREGVGSPRPFYERFGFVPTGEITDGEVEARLLLAE